MPETKPARDASDYYDIPGIGRLTAVTTIIDALGKPALIEWAARTTAEAAAAEYCGIVHRFAEACQQKASSKVLQSILAAGLATVGNAEHLRRARFAKRDARRRVGSLVHDVLENRAYGAVLDLGPYDDDTRKCADALLTYLQTTGYEFEAAEATVYNPAEGYAGRLDSLGRFPDPVATFGPDLGPHLTGLGCLDIKVGKDSYTDHCLQLAAYRRCTGIVVGKGAQTQLVAMPETHWGAVLVVTPDGCFLKVHDCGDRGYVAFKAAMTIYRTTAAEDTRLRYLDAPLVPVPAEQKEAASCPS